MSSSGPISLDRLPASEFAEEEATIAEFSHHEFELPETVKAAAPAKVAAETLHSPYLAEGAKRHSERYGNLVDEAKRWRWAFLAMAVVNAVLAAGYVINYRTPQVTPYVVQVDEHGYAIAIEPAERSSAAEERVVIAEVANFFRTMRTVIADPDAQVALVEETYSHVSSDAPAKSMLDQWYRQNNPMAERALQTSVEITRVQPLGDSNTLTVEWTETKASGQQIRARYSALVTAEIRQVMTQEELIGNPLGVFVKQFSIERLD